MEITEIRVKLADDSQERLLAFCTITLDDAFVVRDVKVIDGPKGPFVAMPSRKVTARCPRCRDKNHLRANYCNSCGERLASQHPADDGRGRPRLYVDIAHPINQDCRAHIEQASIQAFQEEKLRARQPGYVAPDLDDPEDFEVPRMPAPRRSSRPDGRVHGAAEGGTANGS